VPQRFCQHLEEYGVQFVKTEAAYKAFNALVDRAVAEEDTSDLRRALERALDDWQREVRTLRNMFMELYNAGRILLPKNALNRHHHEPGHMGQARCSDCFRDIPRLVYPEWQLAHNGAVNFRGEELDLDLPDLTVTP